MYNNGRNFGQPFLEIIFHTYPVSLISYHPIQATLGIAVFLVVAEIKTCGFPPNILLSIFFRNRTSGFQQGSWLLRINTVCTSLL